MMLIRLRKLFIILLFISPVTIAQNHNWFPSDINIQPFTANMLEPKAGFLISTDNNKLRLDISTSRDIIHWVDDNSVISIGADVFTFTRLRSNDDFKFPVETIDYLFGVNAGYKKHLEPDNEFGFRFRLSHISTHLVDGQYDAQTQKWREGREPFVYSKEFMELFPYYRYKSIRAYLGFTYIFHIIPAELKKINMQFGFDYFAAEIGTELFTPFVAYDFKLNGIDKFIGNNIISVGVKFGNWQARGLSFYYSYISGTSIHGQLFDLRENYSNIGFNFEL
ncbi:MAG: hypothetical protein B6D44_14335 [Ignavibacteriales bacterium UTCHB2]|nr:MAG: hypothetical protein BWY38_00022 [Ignavibacteria bacterium ADurb.Bin266]OQY70951.1 MAG: hypothetical protein B6D44_14335 [Ignavibacteriales bacterium UTCHB2]HQI40817.1 DUF1207 domain-containing protein [Ignavibacteriaceae bacterium]